MRLRIIALCVLVLLSGCAYQATSQYAVPKLYMQTFSEEQNVIFETQYWRIVLHENQSYLGRAVVRLKRPCGDIACVTKDELEEWHTIVVMMQDAARSAFSMDAPNWDETSWDWAILMNHAFRENPPTPLVHWHFVPRYRSPVQFAGEVFTDGQFGNNWREKPERKVSEEVARQIIRAYQEELQKISGKGEAWERK